MAQLQVWIYIWIDTALEKKKVLVLYQNIKLV